MQTQKPAVRNTLVRAYANPNAKPKRKQNRRNVAAKAKPVAKPKPAALRINVSKTLGASIGLRNPVKADGSMDVGALLIVMGLALAIACFAIAMVPARSVPWGRGAIFVSERQVDLTMLGFGLLLVTAFAVIWTQGA